MAKWRVYRKAQGMREAESDVIQADSLEDAQECAGDWAAELVESWVDEDPVDGDDGLTDDDVDDQGHGRPS